LRSFEISSAACASTAASRLRAAFRVVGRFRANPGGASQWLDKNDPKDAQVILHMLRIGATQTYCDPIRAGIHNIQELSKTHEVVSRAKTEL
jgi:hypothetical protein